MRRTFKIAGAVVVLTAVAYLLGPLWAGWQLRQAIRTRDVAAMQTRVDWPQLRANLKPRVADAIKDNAANSGVIAGTVKRAVGSALSGTAIDALVTPGNLGRILAGRAFMLERLPASAKPSGEKAPTPTDDASEDPDDPVPPKRVRWAFFDSPTRFRVEALNPRLPNHRVVAILALQGISWKLVDVDIVKR